MNCSSGASHSAGEDDFGNCAGQAPSGWEVFGRAWG